MGRLPTLVLALTLSACGIPTMPPPPPPETPPLPTPSLLTAVCADSTKTAPWSDCVERCIPAARMQFMCMENGGDMLFGDHGVTVAAPYGYTVEFASATSPCSHVRVFELIPLVPQPTDADVGMTAQSPSYGVCEWADASNGFIARTAPRVYYTEREIVPGDL